MVQINSSQDSHFAIPFGGYKQSGIGRELGEYALTAYTQVKAVHGKASVILLRSYNESAANLGPNSKPRPYIIISYFWPRESWIVYGMLLYLLGSQHWIC